MYGQKDCARRPAASRPDDRIPRSPGSNPAHVGGPSVVHPRAASCFSQDAALLEYSVLFEFNLTMDGNGPPTQANGATQEMFPANVVPPPREGERPLGPATQSASTAQQSGAAVDVLMLEGRIGAATVAMERALNEATSKMQESIQIAMSALEQGPAAQAAMRVKRHMSEADARDATRNSLTIQAIRSKDSATEQELTRCRYSVKQFEEAATGARLARDWIRDEVSPSSGRTTALRDLDSAVTACDAGSRGMLLTAVLMEKVDGSARWSHEWAAGAATRTCSNDLTGFDDKTGISKHANEQIAAREKDTLPGAAEARPQTTGPRLATSGDKCVKCKKFGHFGKDCPTGAAGTSPGAAAGSPTTQATPQA